MKALTRSEVRKTLKKLREMNIRPPAVNRCVTVRPADPERRFQNDNGRVELCRHSVSRHIPNDTGYVLDFYPYSSHGLFGARRRRR